MNDPKCVLNQNYISGTPDTSQIDRIAGETEQMNRVIENLGEDVRSCWDATYSTAFLFCCAKRQW